VQLLFSSSLVGILPEKIPVQSTDSPITQTLKSGYTGLAGPGDQNGALALATAGGVTTILGWAIASISIKQME
jgi:hypothetical protein